MGFDFLIPLGIPEIKGRIWGFSLKIAPKAVAFI
jgi:hypothetical protein